MDNLTSLCEYRLSRISAFLELFSSPQGFESVEFTVYQVYSLMCTFYTRRQHYARKQLTGVLFAPAKKLPKKDG